MRFYQLSREKGVVCPTRNPSYFWHEHPGHCKGAFRQLVKVHFHIDPVYTDGNGNTVQYRYNSFGKVSERTNQLGYAETFRYDEERGTCPCISTGTTDGCSVFGKLVYEKATDARGNDPNIRTWHYDSLGRVTRAVCDGHSYEYVYDAQCNLKEKRSSGKYLISYVYDKMGQIMDIKDPAGVCTHYEYDILGRRSRIYNDEGLEVRYAYDALNRISRIHYGNGVETAYAYDGNRNRIVKTGTQAGIGGITSEITVGNNAMQHVALDISYRYDIRGQLLEERRNGGSVCYAYDKTGNRIRKTDTNGSTLYRFNGKISSLRRK